jgi:hypothetical protein
MTFPVLSANGPTGYNLTRSLRFRSSASAYLSRTPASASNQKTWTWSGWVKRGALGALQGIFGAGSYTNGAEGFQIAFQADDTLRVFEAIWGSATVFLADTVPVYRDPSSWYHLVVILDTTQATSTNRLKIYINNSLVTVTNYNAPALNTNYVVNGTSSHTIGKVPNGSSGSTYYFDAYLAEVNFIDGQALTPSSFGSTNSVTGVWQPARYTGTYGTNGFYLPFTDNSALTTSSNAGLGKDFSGNANYWVTNNISITAGSTYDSMTDVPTLTSATAANFAVWNPNFKDTTANTTSTSNANLTTNGQFAFSSIGVTTDKFYFELTIGSANNQFVGVCASPYAAANLRAYNKDGTYYTGSGWISYGATYTTSDVIGVALDMTNQTIEFFKNNTSQGQKTSIGLSGQTIFPMIYVESSGGITVNFGQQPFTYTPPTGFIRLNTYNLPASTVPNGASYMAATLYTGTLLSNTISNAVGSASFQPDLVWIKSRSAATDNKLTDSVRGVTKGLISNTTGAETTDTQGLTAFGSTGFTVGTNTDYNNLAATYVAWQWKGGGTAVSNTNGTITSSVSANTTSGCSVVTFTGQTSGVGTIGHGLGVAPSLIIIKARANAYGWPIYHVSLGNTSYVVLNSTNGPAVDPNEWNNTSPTSSVFTLATNFINYGTGVAYCFAAIKGFSAFGSYTGNGSTDGPFVYLGFRPRFVMIKKTDTSDQNWYILDTARSTSNGNNVLDYKLYPNTSGAENSGAGGGETTSTNNIDALSNGFKCRSANAAINASGGSFIYAAFAENPFQNALAR